MRSNIFSNQYILNKMNKFEEFKNGKVAISHDVTAEEMKIILTEAFPEDLAREDQKEVYNRKDKIYYREETLSEMHGHSIWCTIFPEWKSIKTYKASEILEELNAKTFAEWCDYINSPAVKLQMYQKEEIKRFKHFLTQTDSIKRHPYRGKSIVQNLIENVLRAERPEQNVTIQGSTIGYSYAILPSAVEEAYKRSERLGKVKAIAENEFRIEKLKDKVADLRWETYMQNVDIELNQEAIKVLQNQKNRYKGLFVLSTVIYFIIVFYLLIR